MSKGHLYSFNPDYTLESGLINMSSMNVLIIAQTCTFILHKVLGLWYDGIMICIVGYLKDKDMETTAFILNERWKRRVR